MTYHEVKFDSFSTYMKAYWWCREEFEDDRRLWKSNYNTNLTHLAILFKNNEDAMLCALRWL